MPVGRSQGSLTLSLYAVSHFLLRRPKSRNGSNSVVWSTWRRSFYTHATGQRSRGPSGPTPPSSALFLPENIRHHVSQSHDTSGTSPRSSIYNQCINAIDQPVDHSLTPWQVAAHPALTLRRMLWWCPRYQRRARSWGAACSGSSPRPQPPFRRSPGPQQLLPPCALLGGGTLPLRAASRSQRSLRDPPQLLEAWIGQWPASRVGARPREAQGWHCWPQCCPRSVARRRACCKPRPPQQPPPQQWWMWVTSQALRPAGRGGPRR